MRGERTYLARVVLSCSIPCRSFCCWRESLTAVIARMNSFDGTRSMFAEMKALDVSRSF